MKAPFDQDYRACEYRIIKGFCFRSQESWTSTLMEESKNEMSDWAYDGEVGFRLYWGKK